jgi:hypothetical protein
MKSKTTLQASLPPMLLNSLDGARPVVPVVSAVDQSSSISLMSVVKDVLVQHFGSLKAAAISFAMDQGQLTRELQSGDFKFRRLDAHQDGDSLKRAVACGMYGAFGDDDPGTRVRRAIREAKQKLDEIDDLVTKERTA